MAVTLIDWIYDELRPAVAHPGKFHPKKSRGLMNLLDWRLTHRDEARHETAVLASKSSPSPARAYNRGEGDLPLAECTRIAVITGAGGGDIRYAAAFFLFAPADSSTRATCASMAGGSGPLLGN